MDLFVFPSNYEGLGSTLLDAMGFEVPIIASAVGGIPDIITHGKNGYLVSPGDTQAIIQAIEHLYHNPELRQRLASGSKSQLSAYSPEKMVKRYRELYRSVVPEA
jgi:glycosyltransferase involved in cell wall biosynthesis